ncbi:MAG: BON domain-containing protein [Terracidiphilus sp.]|nr:BON domain-containing protein [Terracidiphilus sp.]
MTKTMRRTQSAFWSAALAGALLSLPQVSLAAGPAPALPSGATVLAGESSPAASDAAARLNKKQFRNVKVDVDNGIATLTGSVDLYEYKADAEKHVRHARGITAVRNLIEVAGPSVTDAELQTKLQEKLQYDRVGYGNTFNAISVHVENGAAILGGHARTDVDKDSALALIATSPGVKDVVDEIEVDPTSMMDDQARLQVARAVYGFPTLNKYAMNPAKPIRISVRNGHVELYGMVDSQADKDTAFLRANGVSGVFGVKNYLEVANQPSEGHK